MLRDGQSKVDLVSIAPEGAMASLDEGYEENRFEKEVDRNLHCSICMNVLKDPKQCRRNEHYFCSPCIRRHLEQNSTTCPICIEELTPETLVEPPRIVTDILGSLKIRCDYERRGCPELVELEFLERHVVNCGYSPTLCGNDGCAMIINKKDEEHHETEVCGYRKVKCEDCGKQIQNKKYNVHGCVTRKEVDKMKVSLSEMKTDLTEVRDQLELVRNEIQRSQQDMMNEMRAMMAEMKKEISQKAESHSSTRDRTMADVKEKIESMEPCTEGPHNVCKREDIIIAGGYNGKYEALKSVEMFNWRKRAWERLQPMKQCRALASAFRYRQHVFVAGGATNTANRDSSMTETIECVNVNQEPKQWFDFAAKLPFKSRGHKSDVYQNRVIVTGGNCGDMISDGIYEVLLTPPYSKKLLCKMPQRLWLHGSELFDDKIVIFGGRTSKVHSSSSDTVLMYDITNNVCRKLKPLPLAVSGMATVSCDNNVILMGGADKNGNVLNSVITYDTTTEKCTIMPRMKYNRDGRAAVITEDVVVVVGGYYSELQKAISCVEYCNLDRYVWEELPPMIERRSYPVAVVKPFA